MNVLNKFYDRLHNRWQKDICKTTPTSPKVNQLSLFRKWHIRSNSCSLRTRIQIEWRRNRPIKTFLYNGSQDNDSEEAKLTTKHRTAKKTCRFCKKSGHVIKKCRKRIRKELERQKENQTIEKLNARTYPSYPDSQRSNRTADMSWSGPKADDRPKRYKSENKNDSTDQSRKPQTSTQNAPTSIFKNPLNQNHHDTTDHQWNLQFNIKNPTHLIYFTTHMKHETKRKGYPSVVWLQQMKTTYTERLNKMHLFGKQTPTCHNTAKQNIPTPFRHSPEMPDYEPQFIDLRNQRDLYWDDHLYNQEKHLFENGFDKYTEQIEDFDILTDSHVSP